MAKQSNAARNATRRLRYLLTHPTKVKKTREEKNSARRETYAKKHPKPNEPFKPIHSGPIKNSDFIPVNPPETYEYLNRYTYRLTYLVTNKQGFKTRMYYNVTSYQLLPKYELKEIVWDNCGRGEFISQYSETKVIKSSIQLIDIIYNKNS